MAGITAGTVATYAAITAAVASTAGAVVKGVTDYNAGKIEEAQNKINAAQARNAATQTYQEESLNATQHYRAVRQEIASGQNRMAGSGNIGTSADVATTRAYFNLSEDLSALRYRYDNEAAGYLTQGKNFDFNANAAAYNRRMGVLANSINTVGTAAKGVTQLYTAGQLNTVLGAGGSKKPRVTVTEAVDDSGMYGAWSGK